MKKRICAQVCAILLCCGLAAAGAEPVQSTLESGENIFVFSLIGDCCIGDNAWSPGTQGGYLNKIKKAGFDYPFSLVADMFAEDDLTVANCECTFTDRLKHRNGIYFPMLAPTILLVLIVNTISCFKVFSELYPLFNGKPGPYYNLYTVVYYIRYAMVEKRKYGYAAAAAMIFFLVVLIFTLFQLRLKSRMQKRGLQ